MASPLTPPGGPPAGPPGMPQAPTSYESPAIITSAPPRQIEREEERKAVKFAFDSFTYLRGELMEPHTRWVTAWKRYFTQRPDLRDPVTERWRSHITEPQMYYNTEAKDAQLVEILFSADPPIQPDPVLESSEETSLSVTRLLDHTMRINYFRKILAAANRDISCQGVAFLKTTWAKKTINVPRYPYKQQHEEFERAMNEALQSGVVPMTPPDPYMQPEAFEKWRELINKAQPNLRIPPAPPLEAGMMEVLRFFGPQMELLNPWQVLLNPSVQEIGDQPIVIHEVFKPRSWVTARTGPEAHKPFDPEAVGDAMQGWNGESLTDQQREVMQALGIPANQRGDPQFEVPMQIWECYRPNCEFPFQVILNQKRIINKTPRAMPFIHGMVPITPLRHVTVRGMALGVSDHDPARGLMLEKDLLRSLRLDSVTLRTLPVFKKLLGLGIPDLQRRLMPGGFIEVNRMDGLEPLISGDVNPSSFSEVNNIGLDIDRAFGIGDNVRGASSTIGRVSATDATQRLTNALTRLKLQAANLEDDLQPAVYQWLTLWSQFGWSEDRAKRSGRPDPLRTLNPETLLDELASDYRFRGATQAIQKELQAQQMQGFVDKFRNDMTPMEIREVMKQVATVQGMRSLSKIISKEGTDIMMRRYQMQIQAEQAQMQGQIAQMQQQQAAGALPQSQPAGQGATPQPGGQAPPEGGQQ